MGSRNNGRYRPKMIAPRLASGDSRVGIGHGLPEDIKEGLKRIAAQENRSLSWVLEEVLIDHFHLRRPKYLAPKPKPEPGTPRTKERDR